MNLKVTKLSNVVRVSGFGLQGESSREIRTDSISTLKSIPDGSIPDGWIVSTLGYYADGDGGEGVYRYDSSSSATADDGSVIAPTHLSGRFFLQLAPEVNVRQFGAKGDGTTDDTSRIQAAATYAKTTGKPLVFTKPSVGYRCSSTLDLRDIKTIRSPGMLSGVLILSTVTTTAAIQIGGGSGMLVDADIEIAVCRPGEANDWASGSVGVSLQWAQSCKFKIRARGFEKGLHAHPTTGQQIAYCSFVGCALTKCVNNLSLEADGTGYIICNMFSGGVNYVESYGGAHPLSHVYIKTTGASSYVADNLWNGNMDFSGDSVAYANNCAIFRVFSEGIGAGTLNLRVEDCRQEASLAATRVCVINIEDTADDHVVEFFCEFNNDAGNVLYPVIAVPAKNHRIDVTRKQQNSQSPVSRSIQGALTPCHPFIDGAGAMRAPGRVIYRIATASYQDSIAGGTLIASGDDVVTWSDGDFAIGQIYRKTTGQSTWLRVGDTSVIGATELNVLCWNSAGVQLSGTAPYYVLGRNQRTRTSGSSNFYQTVGGWLWLHEDVATFLIVQSAWNSGIFVYSDLQLEFGAGARVQIGSPPSKRALNIVSPGAPRATFPVGTTIGNVTAPGGMIATFELATTASSTAAAAAAAVIVTSATGVLAGDTVLVQVDTTTNGQKRWEAFTVSSVAGTTINLSGALSAQCSSGNQVKFNRWSSF